MSDFWHNFWVVIFLITLALDAIGGFYFIAHERPKYTATQGAMVCVGNLLMLWAFWNLVGGWA